MRSTPRFCSQCCHRYTNAIKACADAGELDKAQTLFAYMEVAGVGRNQVTYAVMIDGYSRNGGWASMATVPSLAGQSSPSQPPHIGSLGLWLFYTP